MGNHNENNDNMVSYDFVWITNIIPTNHYPLSILTRGGNTFEGRRPWHRDEGVVN